jgi:AraC family transcriptional regulator, arabinose operon regulatory protein
MDASATERDNSYVLGYQGFVYTSRRIASGPTTRYPGVLLLSADYQPFVLTPEGGPALSANAAVVAPRVTRSLQARGVPLLSFNVMPSHDAYHVFRAMQRPGVLAVDRYAFGPLDEALGLLCRGEARLSEAALIFEQALRVAVPLMPPAAPPDATSLQILRMLENNPELGLDELARVCGRSQAAMSRLFSAAVGMSLRDYHGWLKQRRTYNLLCSSRSLTDVAQAAGFVDSPHFSRTFARWYGQSPSFSRDPKFVRVINPRQSHEAVALSQTEPEGLIPLPTGKR